ncbi:MAG: hypothetical protein ACSLFF_02760 [Solirubrobacterales bacterium]
MQALFPRLTTPHVALIAVAFFAFGLSALGAGQAGAAGRYVAVGDSGSLGTQYPGSRPLCWQTQNSYPVFVASAFDISNFASAACSAAWVNDFTTTQELWNPSTMAYEDTAPPQFDTLNGTETLVTISIGVRPGVVQFALFKCSGSPAGIRPAASVFLGQSRS